MTRHCVRCLSVRMATCRQPVASSEADSADRIGNRLPRSASAARERDRGAEHGRATTRGIVSELAVDEAEQRDDRALPRLGARRRRARRPHGRPGAARRARRDPRAEDAHGCRAVTTCGALGAAARARCARAASSCRPGRSDRADAGCGRCRSDRAAPRDRRRGRGPRRAGGGPPRPRTRSTHERHDADRRSPRRRCGARVRHRRRRGGCARRSAARACGARTARCRRRTGRPPRSHVGAPARELAAEHPVVERLGDDRRTIAPAGGRGDRCDVGRRRLRRDPVDRRRHEGHVLGEVLAGRGARRRARRAPSSPRRVSSPLSGRLSHDTIASRSAPAPRRASTPASRRASAVRGAVARSKRRGVEVAAQPLDVGRDGGVRRDPGAHRRRSAYPASVIVSVTSAVAGAATVLDEAVDAGAVDGLGDAVDDADVVAVAPNARPGSTARPAPRAPRRRGGCAR